MPSTLERFRKLLDEAKDEAPLQRFLSETPWPLLGLGGFKHVFDKVRVGPKYVTDFASVVWGNYSIWTLVELESPRARLFTKAGLYSRQLSTALRQVNDWLIWQRDFAEVGGEEMEPLQGEVVEAAIVIGRRRDLSRTDRRRLVQLNSTVPAHALRVVTYDTLLDFAEEQTPEAVRDFEGPWRARVKQYPTVSDFKAR